MVAPKDPLQFLDLLYQAKDSQFGIEVATTDPHRLRSTLYSTMREAKAQGIEDFENFSLAINPACPTTFLWIKNGKKS